MSNTGKKELTTGCETPCSSNGFVKSSAYAPVSLNLMGMYLVKEHMNAHYKRIYNVKASVDTRAPLSMQNRIKSAGGASRVNSRCSSRHSYQHKSNFAEENKYLHSSPSTNSPPALHYAENATNGKSTSYAHKLQRAERLREYLSESFGPCTSAHKDRPFRKHTNRDKCRVVPALRIQRDLDHARWLKDRARKQRAEEKLDQLERSLEMDDESDEDSDENYAILNSPARPTVSPKHRQMAPPARISARSSPKRYSTVRCLVKEQLEAEEEELRYLEFITDVTNDILLRGVYTDRALKQVFQYHMNRRNDLNFNKMKNLLGKLQDDLGIPRFEKQFPVTSYVAEPEENALDKRRNEKKTPAVHFSPELRRISTNSSGSESNPKEVGVDDRSEIELTEQIDRVDLSVGEDDEESFEDDSEMAAEGSDKDLSINYSDDEFCSSRSGN